MLRYRPNHNAGARKRAIAAALCLLLLFALCGCSLFGGEGDDILLEEPVDATVGYRQTVLYFETDDGLMVPVMKLLPWEEGIGRAALNQLVDTDENRISAAAMGLKNVVPQGVSFVLSIADDAVATVNIIDMPALENAQAEQNFVAAVVNTLTEFPAIEQVQMQFDGKLRKNMPHGTAVQGAMHSIALNKEPLPVSMEENSAHYALTLYFPNKAASLHIPVTRTVSSEPTLLLAMQELVEGPVDTTLRHCFPAGTDVLSASLVDQVAVVNLSKEFADLQQSPDLEMAALESMQLTAKQFGTVTALHVQVEGTDYLGASETSSAMPVFANTYR